MSCWVNQIRALVSAHSFGLLRVSSKIPSCSLTRWSLNSYLLELVEEEVERVFTSGWHRRGGFRHFPLFPEWTTTILSKWKLQELTHSQKCLDWVSQFLDVVSSKRWLGPWLRKEPEAVRIEKKQGGEWREREEKGTPPLLKYFLRPTYFSLDYGEEESTFAGIKWCVHRVKGSDTSLHPSKTPSELNSINSDRHLPTQRRLGDQVESI